MKQRISNSEKERLFNEVIPIAAELRKSFINNFDVIKDSFQTIEHLGYLLIRFPAQDGNQDISGFHIKKGNVKCIYINTNQNLGRQFFSVWHEFYHAETGDGTGISYVKASEVDPSEFKADAAAGYILMPDNLIRSYIQENYITFPYISYKQIIEMQNYFRVGYGAVVQRLIYVYPEHRETLSKRFALSRNTPEQRKKMENEVKNAGGDIKLITATKDIYIPKSFFDDLEFNMKNERISHEKAFNILKYVEGLGNSD